MNKQFLFLSFFALLTACVSPGRKAKKHEQYFDIETVIDSQIQLLDSLRPNLSKTALLNGKTEHEQLEGSQINWEHELSSFKNTNLNEPAYWGNYRKTHLGQTITRYVLKAKLPEKKFPVKWVELHYAENAKHSLRMLKARTSQKNELFELAKNYRVNFDEQGRINTYLLEGVQKIKLKDSVHYQIIGRIDY
ncbi:MAG: hypothetical protein MI784_01465 [Cytophagales bacterium]|nr:hypothetical protein [Cytophagales bacterium]